MMKSIFFSTCFLLLSVAVIAQKTTPAPKKGDVSKTTSAKTEAKPERIALISTEFGDMKVKLYNSTPQHRDNFVKLAEKGFYDSLLFHRVINSFMIQGGDPESKNAPSGQVLGNGDVGYTIPAEFNDSLYHKKGALCAARTENPEKVSSGCQFYIVQGKTASDEELNSMESNVTNGIRMQTVFQDIINRPKNAALKEKFVGYQQNKEQDSLNELVKTTIMPMINAELKPFKYSASQREAYKTIGGTAQLDQGYTVYGEVIEGLEVIDKIAAVQTGAGDRPVQDVRMKVKMIN